ncbi:MAG: hypothetical protein ACHQRM_12145 [Bacteroidia bacterium]
MKHLLYSFLILNLFTACNSDKTQEQQIIPPGVHKAVVEEALQTTQYTYLHVKDKDQESWLAVTKMQAAPGDIYYFHDALPMNNFESKELKRTFPVIYFLDQLSTTPSIAEKKAIPAPAVQPNSAEAVTPENNMAGPTRESASTLPVNHTVVAGEILQTSQYTYIKGKEGKDELWLAATRMEAKPGQTFYFKGGLVMTDFVSKELKRTFKQILFVDNISTTAPGIPPKDALTQSTEVKSPGSAVQQEKKEVSLKHEKGDITVAAVQEKRKSYSGKTIRIKGQVTKFNSGIMKKNWIHIQDGTEWSGKFDLTVTTDQEVKVGDMITLEGIINTDKDFGFGYFYEVLMEDAKLIK